MKTDTSNDKRILRAYIISLFIVVSLIAFSFIYCRIVGLESLRPDYIRDVSIDMTAMMLCGVLIFSIANDKPWDKQNRSLFRLIFTLEFIFFLDVASSFMEGNSGAATGVMFVNTLSFFNETMLIYCFWAYIREELHLTGKTYDIFNNICRGALVIDLIADVLNIFFGYLFTVNANAEYVAGKFENCSQITSVVIYVIIWIVILKAKEHSLKERMILLTFQIFPVMANIGALISKDFAAVLPAYLLSLMLIYINVFSTRSKKILEQKVTLDQQRATLMVSQIQPHFLYNVLTTISNLCVTDPEEAEETTVLFSQYLRTNLDSLRKTEPVPFGTELGHIQTYVELEKKRFGDKLNIDIDCPEKTFLVPALGLQPIVENSVKHGIRGKDTPGHLYITSRKVEGGYEVVIEDDGVGFDMNAPVKDDGRSHVGMINTKSRLEQICGAKVDVESSPGNGCKTTVFFPGDFFSE